MQCPSCGAISENNDCCDDLVLESVLEQERSDWAAVSVSNTVNQSLGPCSATDLTMNSASDLSSSSEVRKSTLIEFPGVNRTPVPQWRKELSERVREVQERRAREAREAIELEQSQTQPANLQPQLELLPAVETPPVNPLVAAALKRIERAHQPPRVESGQAVVNMLATAVAYAPACEENDLEVPIAQVLEVESENPVETLLETEQPPPIEKKLNLIVVPVIEEPPVEIQPQEPPPIPKRLILEDPNDPALNYLDSISRTIRVEEADTHRASAFRRLICALLDLMICALLTAPIGLAMELTGTSAKDPRAVQVLAGCLVIVTFIYLTLSTALTGRTVAMRLFALRIIDTKTGLIPTGSQSVGRTFLYLGSLAVAGIGILAALVNREGYAVHDRLTRTAVIRT